MTADAAANAAANAAADASSEPAAETNPGSLPESRVLAVPHAVLFDIDGTLLEGDHWLPGALEAVRWCQSRGLVVRFITNTTMRSRAAVTARLASQEIAIREEHVFTPMRAGADWLSAQHMARGGLFTLAHPDLHADLAAFPLTDDPTQADFVLVGDLGDAWTIEALHQGLRALLNGARLIALQANRHWRAADGFRLDAGAFVAALEYGADVRCEALFGKPSPLFFQMVLASANTLPAHAVMVGDDIESDVIGAMRQGLRGVLVKTGKFRPQTLSAHPPIDHVIASAADLPALLGPLLDN